MDSLVIYDPRVEKLKKELFSQLKSNQNTLSELRKTITAGSLVYKAVKRGKSIS